MGNVNCNVFAAFPRYRSRYRKAATPSSENVMSDFWFTTPPVFFQIQNVNFSTLVYNHVCCFKTTVIFGFWSNTFVGFYDFLYPWPLSDPDLAEAEWSHSTHCISGNLKNPCSSVWGKRFDLSLQPTCIICLFTMPGIATGDSELDELVQQWLEWDRVCVVCSFCLLVCLPCRFGI